ncbi:MAG: MBL fold metallo-hydrolase [Deltaproteobacteria bacterium]|nr:MBL fold metallo-hydrolase [Deltaproteobacteria bacterium]
MSKTPYEGGLVEVGDGLHAYLQPMGAWGLSNAGFVVGDGASLLVDTLYDRPRTEALLAAIHKAAPGVAIDSVVNTHANGDHCWGNGVLPDSTEIIASASGAAEMEELPPAQLGKLVKASKASLKYGAPVNLLLKLLGSLGKPELKGIPDAAAFVVHAFGAYDFDSVELRTPTRTFEGSLTLDVGGRAVELVDVGPAHTKGDVLIHVPDSKTVFTGDILFADAHPILWAGPFSNWIDACDRILAWEPETVVPGHGPLATVKHVTECRDYMQYVLDESTRRHAAGMGWQDAARDIALDGFSHWTESERIMANVRMAYYELDATLGLPDAVELFASMAAYWKEHGQA